MAPSTLHPPPQPASRTGHPPEPGLLLRIYSRTDIPALPVHQSLDLELTLSETEPAHPSCLLLGQRVSLEVRKRTRQKPCSWAEGLKPQPPHSRAGSGTPGPRIWIPACLGGVGGEGRVMLVH